MKKFFISLGLLCLFAGLCIVGIFGARYGFSAFMSGYNFETKGADKHYVVSDVTETTIEHIQVNTDLYAVLVESSAEVEQLQVNYYALDKIDIEFSVQENTQSLSIVQKQANSIWNGLDLLNQIIAGNQRKMFLEILIPEGQIVSLDVQTSIGLIDIKNATFSEVSADNRAGTIRVQQTQAVDMNVNTDFGNVNVKNVQMTNDFVATCDAGDIYVKEVTASSASLSTSAGSVRVDTATFQTSQFSVEAGSLYFTKLISEKITATISAGSIMGNIIGDKKEYTIDVSVDAGSSNLSNQTGTTEKTLLASVNSGSLNITFGAL